VVDQLPEGCAGLPDIDDLPDRRIIIAREIAHKHWLGYIRALTLFNYAHDFAA
jgi:hypothetical protein